MWKETETVEWCISEPDAEATLLSGDPSLFSVDLWTCSIRNMKSISTWSEYLKWSEQLFSNWIWNIMACAKNFVWEDNQITQILLFWKRSIVLTITKFVKMSYSLMERDLGTPTIPSWTWEELPYRRILSIPTRWITLSIYCPLFSEL